MSAESIVYDALRLNAPLVAFVGTRIFPDAIAEGELMPAIVFMRAGTEPIITIDGTIHANRVSMRVETWAATRTSAEDICNAVVSALLVAKLYYNQRGGGFDPEVGAFASTLDVDVWV